eukprot:CAMPEP_0184128246 /NCGR_PEP_ID=MMETSP0974-20121125/26484_1 /TAXON_ID=483370 /ORGANISM="non described non described, Strain CCMP2097" /LENGTH=45 /DNA_ID= /DNA_START= /DNA_END= /DNA_ORIENTATION=
MDLAPPRRRELARVTMKSGATSAATSTTPPTSATRPGSTNGTTAT